MSAEEPIDAEEPDGESDGVAAAATGDAGDGTDGASGQSDPGEDESVDADPTAALSDQEQLAGELARLEAENERLRQAYAQRTQTKYRQTALALVAVGGLAAIGGVLFAGARTVLFALAGTGVFLGILTYSLSPEQFLPASVGREVYASLAGNEKRVAAELGLSDARLYVHDAGGTVRLYVPQSRRASLPGGDALEETFVVDGQRRGVAFEPSGAALFAAFDRAQSDSLAADPAELGPQLTDALVEQFELVGSAEQSVTGTAAEGSLTVGIVDSAYGSLEQFDQPVVSFLAVGLAEALETPITVTVEPGGDRVDAVVTCQWPFEPPDGADE